MKFTTLFYLIFGAIIVAIALNLVAILGVKIIAKYSERDYTPDEVQTLAEKPVNL